MQPILVVIEYIGLQRPQKEGQGEGRQGSAEEGCGSVKAEARHHRLHLSGGHHVHRGDQGAVYI